MPHCALLGIATTLIFGSAALGCTCSSTPPICQRIAGASTALVATVLEGTETPGRPSPFGDRAARVRVERVIHGLDSRVREIFVNPSVGTGCYSGMMPGERWLILGIGLGEGLLTGGCSGSFRIRDEDTLTHRIIESFFSGPNMVAGTVRRNTGIDTSWRKDNLIADAEVEIAGPMAKSVKTTPDGAFEFIGLPKGEYRIAVRSRDLIPAASNEREDDANLKPFQVKERGCVQIPVTMYANQSIRGVVRTPVGAPIEGLTVGLYRAGREVPLLFPMKEVKTDSAGAYEFSRVENGTYLVGTGADTRGGSRASITFHPQAKTDHEAAKVVIHDKSADGIDIIADPHR